MPLKFISWTKYKPNIITWKFHIYYIYYNSLAAYKKACNYLLLNVYDNIFFNLSLTNQDLSVKIVIKEVLRLT